MARVDCALSSYGDETTATTRPQLHGRFFFCRQISRQRWRSASQLGLPLVCTRQRSCCVWHSLAQLVDCATATPGDGLGCRGGDAEESVVWGALATSLHATADDMPRSATRAMVAMWPRSTSCPPYSSPTCRRSSSPNCLAMRNGSNCAFDRLKRSDVQHALRRARMNAT